MKKIVVFVLFACCLSMVVVQPVLAAKSVAGKASVQSRVNVNAADSSALTTLPGIGKVTAERIVAYRTQHGPFKSVDDLVLVKGVGRKTLEKIRPLVTI